MVRETEDRYIENLKINIEEIVQALVFGDKPQEQPLTREVVDQFNLKLGGRIPDETLLRDLKLPNSADPAGNRMYAILSRIGPLLRGAYNASISFTMKNFETVGQLRKAGADEILPPGKRNALVNVYLLTNGFKKSEAN